MRSNIVSFIKWLSARIGYSIAMVKAKDGVIYIEGDRNLIKYFDVSGFISKASPLKRVHDKTYTEPTPLKRLSSEELHSVFNQIESTNAIEKTEE